jgi:hypothetical protein
MCESKLLSEHYGKGKTSEELCIWQGYFVSLVVMEEIKTRVSHMLGKHTLHSTVSLVLSFFKIFDGLYIFLLLYWGNILTFTQVLTLYHS